MSYLIIVLVAGALLGILMFTTQGAIKLFLPRRLGPSVDHAFDEINRWLGRAAVLCLVGVVIFVVWLVQFSPYAGH